MNQYAFNVFLEKSRKNDINEVAPLAAAAARALPTLTRAAAGATRVVGKSATSLRGAAGAAAAGATRVVGKSATSLRGAAGAAPGAAREAGTAFKKGVVRGRAQGQGVRGSLGRGLEGAVQSGVRKIIKDPEVASKVASKVISTGTDFVKTGGFSGQFGREFQQRGAGPNAAYLRALGSLGGGASYQAGKMQTDPFYGLSPAERRRAIMQAGPWVPRSTE